MPQLSKTDQVLKLVQKMGVVRPKDLAGHGLARGYLRRIRLNSATTSRGTPTAR